MPDITLLAPIARLLDISLDTLLSFRRELTAEEISRFTAEADERLKRDSYENVFQWAQKIAAEYPNCPELLLQLAVLLDAGRLFGDISEPERYDDCIRDYYIRALRSEREDTRNRAADSLFGFYMRKEQFDKAEECLAWLSEQNPERKRKQGELYQKTGRLQEACRTFEELLFSEGQRAAMTLQNLYRLALQEQNAEKARYLTEKQSQLAVVFDMGVYHEASCRLDLAAKEKDAEGTLETMQAMLAGVDRITDFRNSPLYEHMDFKELGEDFLKELKKNLIKCFRNEEAFDFLHSDERWKTLIGEMEKAQER